MPDSTTEDSSQPLLSEEQVAAIHAAKPLPPRPRPAFTRRSQQAKPAPPAAIDLRDIPEAIPLDSIPEGIPLDEPPNTARQPQATPQSRPAGDRTVLTPGNRPIQPNLTPKNRVTTAGNPQVAPVEKQPLDRSKFVSFDQYEKGEIPIKPLEKLPGVDSRQIRLEKPKFLDGELPRRIERGVQYPLPGRILFTSVVLLLCRLSLVLTMVGLTLVLVFEPEYLGYALWLPASLAFFGITFVLSANRTRCRICSCHMFYNRRCFKHQKAHRLFGFGYASSAALHALIFRWLRCMYCGTAIRLRQPKLDSEEAEINRPVESQQAEFDKSLIKPRAPK
jgi:hypothetical protein